MCSRLHTLVLRNSLWSNADGGVLNDPVNVTSSPMTIEWPIPHSSSSDRAVRRLRYAHVPRLGNEVAADKVELFQVSDKRCGGTRSLIYIGHQVPRIPLLLTCLSLSSRKSKGLIMRPSHVLVLAWALTCSAATLPACGVSRR